MSIDIRIASRPLILALLHCVSTAHEIENLPVSVVRPSVVRVTIISYHIWQIAKK